MTTHLQRAKLTVFSVLMIAVGLLTSAPVAAQAINAQQRRELYGTVKVQPGLYMIRALHSQWCLGANKNEPVTYLDQKRCNATVPFAILPYAGGGYTIRVPANYGTTGATSIWASCATIARGVIFGPKRIDVLPCDFSLNARSWCDVGANDQRFQFNRAGPSVYAITNYDAGENYADGCFDIRDQSRQIGADTIMFDCNEQANQRFELLYQGPLLDLDTEEIACLRRQNWVSTPDGLRRTVPVMGVDLPGADLENRSTVDDQGLECAARCANNASCRSFTWVRPGLQEAPDVNGTTAVCWLKSGVPDPTANPDTASGIVRP